MVKRTSLFFAAQGPGSDKSRPGSRRVHPSPLLKQMSMFSSCPWDVLCLGAEILTGKSIPVLVGIVRLPIDRRFGWVVLSLGAVAGVLFSVYSSRVVHHRAPLIYANRLVQLSFSLFLSLSLLLSVARGIHYDRGLALSLAPAFCVVIQALPQHQLVFLFSFLLSCVVVTVCASTNVRMHSGTIVIPPSVHIHEDSAGAWETVLRALQLFVLAFYASVQHGPTRKHEDEPHQHHHLLHKRARHPAYASTHHAQHMRYAILVHLISAWLRVAFWYALFHDNTMHVMLENDHSRGGWDWACCVVYMTCLLYGACSTLSQISGQVLPCLALDSKTARIKLAVLLLALAALYRQRDADALFLSTNVLVLLSLAATALTLK